MKKIALILGFFLGFAAVIWFSPGLLAVTLLVLLIAFMHYDYPRFRRNRYIVWGSYLVLISFITMAFIGAVTAPEKSTETKTTAQVKETHSQPFSTVSKNGRIKTSTPLTSRLLSCFGIFFLLGLGWIFSVNRRAISWRPVVWGIVLQIIFGLIVLSPTAGTFFFEVVDVGVKKLLSFSEQGADFVFQTVEPHQIIVGFDPNAKPTTFIGHISPPVKNFAFWVLPTIIFFSSLMTVLYHLGVMEWVIKFFAWVMQKTMGTSGSETLSAAANIFVGQTEAPLVVKPFVESMTVSELHAIMVGGFATVAGGVMAAYVSFLKDYIPGIAGHLVTASIMSAPAALAVSKVMYPETEESVTRGKLKMSIAKPDVNVVEAAARGASEGMTLALNVAAMLVAFVGLVAMINAFLGTIGDFFVWCGLSALKGLSLEMILGWIFAPISWMMGVSWNECAVVGRLLGEKLVLTEFIAYMNLSDILKNGFETSQGVAYLSQRSAIIAAYALCGFANFASIGIQIGGIGGIAPKRRADLAKIGLRAMIGGALAACLTGTIAGIIV